MHLRQGTHSAAITILGVTSKAPPQTCCSRNPQLYPLRWIHVRSGEHRPQSSILYRTHLDTCPALQAEPGQRRAAAENVDLKDQFGTLTHLDTRQTDAGDDTVAEHILGCTAKPGQRRAAAANSNLKDKFGTGSHLDSRPTYHKGNPYNYVALYKKHLTGAEAQLVERRRALDEAYIAYCRKAGEAILPDCLQTVSYASAPSTTPLAATTGPMP